MTWGAYLHTTYISWKIVFKIRYTTYNTPNSFPFMEPLLEDISKENIANCASIPHKFYQRGPNVSHRGRTSTKRPRLFAGAFWRALDHRRHRGCIGGRSKRPPRGHNQRPRARMTTTKKGRQNGQKFHFYVTSIKKKTAIAMANGDEAMKGNSRSSLTDDNLAQSRKQTKKIRVWLKIESRFWTSNKVLNTSLWEILVDSHKSRSVIFFRQSFLTSLKNF